jgi:predicted dehydrogenase
MKLALLGLKGHVGAVLSGARALGDVEVVAVSEDDPKLLASFLKKEPLLQKAQSYEQWRHLIEHTMPDVCCVADENGMRTEQLLALIERDIHIVAEKPLVTTLADLERLRAAFAKSKSQLTMLLELRHQAKNARVREIIQRGDIGEVCQVATQKSYQWGERPAWYRSRARLGGTIPFIGIHSLDIIHWVTALDFTHVAAFHGNVGHPEMGETEDHASVLAQLSNGASVTARIDYLRPAAAATHGDDRLRVVGTKGIVEVNESDEAISLTTREKTERIPFGETENLFVEFAKFLRGGPPPRISADDGFYMTEVVLQARQAADEKTLVALPPRRPARAGKP